jgi:hypothetical protein
MIAASIIGGGILLSSNYLEVLRWDISRHMASQPFARVAQQSDGTELQDPEQQEQQQEQQQCGQNGCG